MKPKSLALRRAMIYLTHHAEGRGGPPRAGREAATGRSEVDSGLVSPLRATMHTFFHDWRRKAGCVALGAACGLAVLWIRSLSTGDLLELRPTRMSQVTIMSAYGDAKSSYQWALEGSFEDDPFFEWNTFKTRGNGGSFLPSVFTGSWGRSDGVSGESAGIQIPYFISAIPLTLLSAYLMIWRPRKRMNKPV
jgi:hypothetical protein